MRRWFFIFLLGACLVGCAVDPRNQADADKTRILANQAAADRAQARSHLEQQFQQETAELEQTSAARVRAWDRFYAWVSLAGSLAVAGVILAVAVGLAWGTVGAGRAAARGAELRSCLIPLNESTRQYPLLIQYTGRGRFSLANPNTGAVMLLDSGMPADRRLIGIVGAVQTMGMATRGAQKSTSPDSLIFTAKDGQYVQR
jgi:hypothetical protein